MQKLSRVIFMGYSLLQQTIYLFFVLYIFIVVWLGLFNFKMTASKTCKYVEANFLKLYFCRLFQTQAAYFLSKTDDKPHVTYVTFWHRYQKIVNVCQINFYQ